MHIINKEMDKKAQFPIGTVLWYRGYGRDGEKFSVCESLDDGRQKVVSMDSLRITDIHPNMITPYEKNRGIGFYTPPEGKNETLDSQQVQELKAKGLEKQEKEAQEREAAKFKADKLLEKGNEWMIENKPADATHAIVAKLERNTSEIQQDYFNQTTDDTVLLAWSTHKRVDFKELRKAAPNFKETIELLPDEEQRKILFEKARSENSVSMVSSNGQEPQPYLVLTKYKSVEILTDMENTAICLFDDEKGKIVAAGWLYKEVAKDRVERGTMGEEYVNSLTNKELDSLSAARGYIDSTNGRLMKNINLDGKENEYRDGSYSGNVTFLGTSLSDGWQVCKVPVTDKDLINACGNGKIYLKNPQIEEAQKKSASLVENGETIKAPTGIEFMRYSEKAFVLTGSGTKEIKDHLMSLQGRYNRFLTNPITGEKMAGWVFSNKKEEEVKKLIGISGNTSKDMIGVGPQQAASQESEMSVSK